MSERRNGLSRERAQRSRLTEDELFLRTAVEHLEELPSVVAKGEAWRVFRIMGEFVEGFDELMGLGPAVSIFGSARTQPDDPGWAQCVETARRLGEAGFSIITGGGPGMMEAANQGAREAGVPSVGLNIELPFEQDLNPHADLKIHFRYFFVRKTMFVKYAQAFVIFPGGFGTMDELFESLTLIQTGKIRDFPLVLFGSDYWGGLLDWLKNTVQEEGKISPQDLDLIKVTDSPQEAVDHIVSRFTADLKLRAEENGVPDLGQSP
ncbi:MAG: TIGR00730 family Rossman fold protein [Gemmatimonadetes bacterium]|nr:TIGR00730 family Rossman fold protein [Gemmatimonadota bacterium]NNM06285.1 TIGR00730 family Rossman fold protein [Gemmatimonadota bacterium]